MQPVFYPAKSTPVQAMSHQLLQENAVGDSVKGFTEVQDCLPRDSLNQCPEQAKVCPLEVHGSGFAHPPPYFATNRELCHIMVAKPKTASNHHISHQSFSVCKQQVKRGTSPALNLIVIIAKFYTIETLPNTQNHPTASPSLPIPSEELIAIHCSTPVLNSIRHQQARCHVNIPMIKKTKILLMAPASEPCVEQLLRFSPLEVEEVERLQGLPQELVSKQFKNIIQRSAPRLDSYEWQGVWNSMGKCLGQWAPPVFWNFTPEQVLNPEKLVEYLEKVCCDSGNSKEIQITAMCWGLAHAYRALFNATQNPQGSGDKTTGTAVAPTPPCDRHSSCSDSPCDRHCGCSDSPCDRHCGCSDSPCDRHCGCSCTEQLCYKHCGSNRERTHVSISRPYT
ncbi:hypothetical protein QYF61_024478 [Mycteria americana]|uniref:Uncharacterized protein n=1 Tax=Mycteria americana TaxID=33587 RepID=A0AAN7N9V2_MYCAM|nr:hypothetical protein QYF61_024478 [Mycteria americana]